MSRGAIYRKENYLVTARLHCCVLRVRCLKWGVGNGETSTETRRDEMEE